MENEEMDRIQVLVDEDGNSILHLALMTGDCKFQHIQQLLDDGAAVNALNDKKQSPLHVYLANTDDHLKVDIIKLLLVRGADVNAKDDWHLTPLHIVTWHSSCTLETIKPLVAHGAQVQLRDINGNSVLHSYLQAMCEPETAVINYLLDHGAQVNALNYNHISLLHCAIKHLSCRQNVIKILLDRGALVYPSVKESPSALSYNFFLPERRHFPRSHLNPHGLKDLIKYSLLEDRVYAFEEIEMNFVYGNIVSTDRDELSQFATECVREINEMVSEIISGSTTLYKFLAAPRQMSLGITYREEKCVLEENRKCDINSILQILSHNKYPLYNDVISGYLITQGMAKRPTLMNKLRQHVMYTKIRGFKEHATVNAVALDYRAASYIAEYLSDEDLLNLVSAFYNPVDYIG